MPNFPDIHTPRGSVITTESGQQIVMLSMEEFNAWQETAYLLSNPANAERLRNDIQAQDLGDVRIVEAGTGQGTFYKVQVGPLTGTGEADRVAQALRPLGINTAHPYTE